MYLRLLELPQQDSEVFSFSFMSLPFSFASISFVLFLPTRRRLAPQKNAESVYAYSTRSAVDILPFFF